MSQLVSLVIRGTADADTLLPTQWALLLSGAYGFALLVMVLLSVYVTTKGSSLLARRKSWVLFVCSNCGSMLLLCGQLTYIWLFQLTVVDPQSPLWWIAQVCFNVGFAITFWPMTIRAWRIVCIFSSTYDFVIVSCLPRLRKVASFTRRIRGNAWCFWRLAFVCAAPLCVIVAIAPTGLHNLQQTINFAYNMITIACTVVVFFRMYLIRGIITVEELVETKMLIGFGLFAVFYFAADNCLWFFMMEAIGPENIENAAAKVVIFELFQLGSMVLATSCTTGYLAVLLARQPMIKITRDMDTSRESSLSRDRLLSPAPSSIN